MSRTQLARRFGWMRRSLLTIWVSALVISLAGWGVAAVIAVTVFRAVGGFCP
jgi:hypothetical protein